LHSLLAHRTVLLYEIFLLAIQMNAHIKKAVNSK
jgi:hypothetical protein